MERKTLKKSHYVSLRDTAEQKCLRCLWRGGDGDLSEWRENLMTDGCCFQKAVWEGQKAITYHGTEVLVTRVSLFLPVLSTQ